MPDPSSPPSSPRPLPGERSRLYRIGVMLLNGYGYNWYRQDNRMRADDLLIRSRASEHLESAAAKLRDLETRYRRQYLPPPTREHPDADPQHLAAVRQFRNVTERILEVDTRLRGAAVPPNDKIWQRHRGEVDSLQRLGECDAVLAAGAKELDDCIAGLLAETGLDAAAEQQIDQHLGQLTATLAERGAILTIAP
jgi:hypothetical protein